LQFLAVSIGALLAFVSWERGGKGSAAGCTLFRNRIVSVAVTAGLLAALVVGGRPCTTTLFRQPVQKVSPISAIVQLMPTDGCRHWEGRRQVLRVCRTGQSGAGPRSWFQLATYLQSPFRPAPCCHVTGPAAHRPGAAANGSRTNCVAFANRIIQNA